MLQINNLVISSTGEEFLSCPVSSPSPICQHQFGGICFVRDSPCIQVSPKSLERSMEAKGRETTYIFPSPFQPLLRPLIPCFFLSKGNGPLWRYCMERLSKIRRTINIVEDPQPLLVEGTSFLLVKHSHGNQKGTRFLLESLYIYFILTLIVYITNKRHYTYTSL